MQRYSVSTPKRKVPRQIAFKRTHKIAIKRAGGRGKKNEEILNLAKRSHTHTREQNVEKRSNRKRNPAQTDCGAQTDKA